ncbi:hypothetical protein HNQ59_003650 [Chitinivorax tropicus]|uniref:Uncharacterized protein n=1 Tax=Chitinivorax tropicus TaxID=714531 RepID=A0A840MYV1_9PROT|nr:hypothetical protein [Chitinivorax tropicus]
MRHPVHIVMMCSDPHAQYSSITIIADIHVTQMEDKWTGADKWLETFRDVLERRHGNGPQGIGSINSDCQQYAVSD